MNAILAILLDQTMNTLFSEPNAVAKYWWLAATEHVYPSIRRRHYLVPEGSSTRGKTVLTSMPANTLAIYTGSNPK